MYKNETYIQIESFLRRRSSEIRSQYLEILSETKLNNILKIFDLKEKVMFKKNSNSEYSEGLYNGAVKQTNHIIRILVGEKINNKNIEFTMLEFLYNIEKALNTLHDEYDVNIAIKEEAVYSEHEEDYWIIAQKDSCYKNFEFICFDFDGIEYNYKPTHEEISKIENEYNKMGK